jgi:hypothetical protein
VDSTCGYADKEGFRCGTGYEFSVFNILTRKKLNLKEKPLTYMDDNRSMGSRVNNINELIKGIQKIKKQNIKYHGNNVLLFHNNIFATKDTNYKEVYEKVIK